MLDFVVCHIESFDQTSTYLAMVQLFIVYCELLQEEYGGQGIQVVMIPFYQMQYKRSYDDDIDTEIPPILQRMKEKTKSEGIPITNLPLIFLQEEDSNLIEKISLEDINES
jgi:hypothetical protein